MTLSELKEHFNSDEGSKERFNKKRKRCIEILADDPDASLKPEDLDIAEKVTHADRTGERRWRPGKLYPEKIFEERFSQRKRAKLSFQREDIDGKKYVRVFNDEAGVLNFDHYEDNSVTHKKDIGDNTMKLSSNQARENYDAVVNLAFDRKKHEKTLTMADLQCESAAEGAAEPAKKLARKDSDDSTDSSGSSSSSAAPLVAQTGQDNKDAAKDKAQKKRKDQKKPAAAAAPFPTEEAEAMEDVPQNKKDGLFLKQTQMKLTAARQVLEHVFEAASMKDVDEGRITSSIRTLDGRMPKILEAQLVSTKRQVEQSLAELRGLTDLLKAVKSFESKLRVSAKQIEAAAGMSAAFESFKQCKLGMARLPWWIRTA